jgi:hypothetical protein
MQQADVVSIAALKLLPLSKRRNTRVQSSFAIILIQQLKNYLFRGNKAITRVSIIRIFIRIFFLENYSLFEYFLTEYSNNDFLLNKP